jgi:hypothetical protein
VDYQPFVLETQVHHPRKGLIFQANVSVGSGLHRLSLKAGDGKTTLEVKFRVGGAGFPVLWKQVFPWRLDSLQRWLDAPKQTNLAVLESKPWATPGEDVVDGQWLALLGDWHPVERLPTWRMARWVGNDPIIEFGFPEGCRAGWLTLEVHPGPGVGAQPFWLGLKDEKGGSLGVWGITGWRTVVIPISSKDGCWTRIRLGASPAGYRVGQETGDPRKLNFAVSRVAWQPVARPPFLGKFVGRLRDPVAIAKVLVSWALGKFQRKHPTDQPSDPLPWVHMNNCGDFTLVDRDTFLASGGHSEEPVFSLNLDTLFLYRLVAMGIPEVCLQKPLEIFHLEHGTGTGATPEGIEELMNRIRSRGIPVLSLDEVLDRARGYFVPGAPVPPDVPDWGLAPWDLEEEVYGGMVQT